MIIEVKSMSRKFIRDGNTILQDTSMASVIDYHISKGTYLRVQHVTKEKLKDMWADIADDEEDILIAADIATDAYVLTSKVLFEKTVREMLKLSKRERALYMDATFKLCRDATILGAIGTSSIKTAVPSRVGTSRCAFSVAYISCCAQENDRIARTLRMKDLGHLAPPKTSTGHYYTLSFRPIVFILGKSESAEMWTLGLQCLSDLAEKLFGVEATDLFSVACADHAAAGHLAVCTRYPGICWLQCWVHMLRKTNEQKPKMPSGWSGDRKAAKADWLRKEIKSMAR
jgi:hypothetical protein